MPRPRSPAIVYTLQRLDALVVQEARTSSLWALTASDPRDRTVLRVDLAEDLAHLVNCATLQRRLAKTPAPPALPPPSATKANAARASRKVRGATP